MGMPDVQFQDIQGIGGQASGTDYISGLLYYAAYPAGFSSGNNIKQIFSVAQAESLGIVNTYSDETTATGGGVTITLVGGVGKVWTISIGGVVLGTYTEITSDAVTNVATGLKNAINANTAYHNFSATSLAGALTITAAKGYGYALNATTGTVACSCSATGTCTVTQFTGGVGSMLAVMHFDIANYFQQRPDGNLWIAVYAPKTFDATEIASILNYANGSIKWLGIRLQAVTFATSHMSLIEAQLETAKTLHQECGALYTANLKPIITASSLPDLSQLTYPKVAAVIDEDGMWLQPAYSVSLLYNTGNFAKWLTKIYQANSNNSGEPVWNTDYWTPIATDLAGMNNFSVGSLGLALGTIALAAVDESIAWPEKFNLNLGFSFLIPGFGTGELYQNLPLAELNTLDTYNYTFMRTMQDVPGTFYNNSKTAITRANDYSSIENNRMAMKARRGVYAALAPKLKGPLYVNPDGTLDQGTIDLLESVAQKPIDNMKAAGELSGTTSDRNIVINPSQSIGTTKQLQVVMQIQPVFNADLIIVYDSLVTKLTQ